MRRISEMYMQSGGTDWKHECKDCKSCNKIQLNSRDLFYCRRYPIPDTEWKPGYVACAFFHNENEKESKENVKRRNVLHDRKESSRLSKRKGEVGEEKTEDKILQESIEKKVGKAKKNTKNRSNDVPGQMSLFEFVQ